MRLLIGLLLLMSALFSVRPASAAQPSIYIAPDVPREIAARWDALARLFPEVAARTKRIEMRTSAGKWIVSYERHIVYINARFGVYVQMNELTRQFAKRAFIHLSRYERTWRVYRTWQQLADALGAGVR